MKKLAFVALVISGTNIWTLLAQEGTIAVRRPTTITSPGHYVLLTNIFSGEAAAITIQSNNVIVNLNGHTVSGTCVDYSVPLIKVDASIAFEGIEIRNGTLRGGCRGIYADARGLPHRLHIAVRDVQVRDTPNGGISLIKAENVEVVRCSVHNSSMGIDVDGGGAPLQGRFNDNSASNISRNGMGFTHLVASEVLRNSVTNFGIEPGEWVGIMIAADPGTPSITVGGNIVDSNTVNPGPNGTGAGFDIATPDNLVSNNTIRNGGDSVALLVRSDGNRIVGNIVSDNQGDGIRIRSIPGFEPLQNLLVGNFVRRNGGCGIRIENSKAHLLRDNIGAGNGTSGPACVPVGNIDLGGNVGL